MASFLVMVQGKENTGPSQFCQIKFNHRFKALKAIDVQINYLWNEIGHQIIETKKAIVEARKKSNKKFWSVIAAVVAGNIIRIGGRVSFTSFFNVLKLIG